MIILAPWDGVTPRQGDVGGIGWFIGGVSIDLFEALISDGKDMVAF